MSKRYDLVIVGGGVMGCMSAFYAAKEGLSVAIIESATLFGPTSASNGNTRSIRSDYTDAFYSNLAASAKKQWLDMNKESGKDIYVPCGCLNVASKLITSDLDASYAARSLTTLRENGIESEELNSEQLQRKFPQFQADAASLDVEGGLIYIPYLKDFLIASLKEMEVDIFEQERITSISAETAVVSTSKRKIQGKKIAILVGRWLNDVLSLVDNCDVQYPLSVDKPQENKYYILSDEQKKRYSPVNFPVFACLDIGIYGHPVIMGKTTGVKIGYYNPPGLSLEDSEINSVESFVEEFLPELRDCDVEDVTGVDQCYYSIASDKEFIVGELPGMPSVILAGGWQGTGFKFAPLIGEAVSNMAQDRESTIDLQRFNTSRFQDIAK